MDVSAVTVTSQVKSDRTTVANGKCGSKRRLRAVGLGVPPTDTVSAPVVAASTSSAPVKKPKKKKPAKKVVDVQQTQLKLATVTVRPTTGTLAP